jgi:1-acyl-sn-glycerol-3-phosphate acyltransferase
MTALRALLRLTIVAATAFGCWLAAVTGSLVLARWPHARSRWRGRVFRLFSRVLCRALGVRVRVSGPAPEPPFVLVSNHVSYLDILVLGTRLPCVFVAKSEIDDWPVFGALCRSVNTVFVDRSSKRDLPRVLARIEEELAASQGIVIFAEGTSGAGDRVMPFRSSLLELPARIGRPVHWAALGYRAPADAPPTHLSITWWGEMPLMPHLRQLLRLRRIEASLTFGAEPVVHLDRKRLADELWRAVDGAFEPMVERAEVERLLALRNSDPSSVPAILRARPGRFEAAGDG